MKRALGWGSVAVLALILYAAAWLSGCAAATQGTANALQQHQQLTRSTVKLATVAFLQRNPGSTVRMGEVVQRLTTGVDDGSLVTVEQAVALVDLLLANSKLDPMTRMAVSELTASIVDETMALLKAMPEYQRVAAYTAVLRSVVGAVHEGLVWWQASPEYNAWKAKQMTWLLAPRTPSPAPVRGFPS